MSESIGEQFAKDPRVIQAKVAILEALKEYQGLLRDRCNSQPEMQEAFDMLVDKMSLLRGRDLFYPYISSGIGKGPLVELADGSVKYDFITGIGVHYFGHSHPKIIEACLEAAIEDTVMQGNLQMNEATAHVMGQLVTAANQQGAELLNCFLTSSGAMANENAFKIIFQKNAPAKRLIAFEHCFTGRSMATVQMTDKPAYREGIPESIMVDHIPFFDHNDPEGSTQRSIDALMHLIEEHPDEYAGMCFELIQGEGGFYPGETSYFVELMKICKTHNIAVMVDEIQTFGRTSKIFAFQHFELDEWVDVVTVGKMTQVCATLFRESYNPKPGLLSQTFTSSSAALKSAQVILEELLKGDLFGEQGKNIVLSNYMRDKLRALANTHPHWIQGPYGLGAMLAFTILDGKAETTKEFLKELFDAGVIAFSAGSEPTRVRFLMPIACLEKKDIDVVFKIVEHTISKVAEQS